MRYFITLSLFFGLFGTGYTQTQPSKEIEAEQSQNRIDQQAKKSNQILTLNLNLLGVSKNDQGALKDDFSTYKRRVLSIDYNEFEETMVITYAGLPIEKIYSLLDKYNINSSAIVNE